MVDADYLRIPAYFMLLFASTLSIISLSIWLLFTSKNKLDAPKFDYSGLNVPLVAVCRYSGARSASNSSLKRSKRCSLTYKKQVKNEQKMQKSSGRALIFRSIVGHHSISARRRHFRHIHSGV